MRNQEPRHRRRAPAVITMTAVTAALTMVISACSSSGSSNGSDAPTTSGAANVAPASASDGASSALAAAQSLVASASKVEQSGFPMPTDPVAAGQRKIYIISPNQADPYSGFAIKNFEDAAKVLGWTVSPIHDAAGSAAKAAGFIEQAIQQKYDAIFYPSMQAQALSTPIKNALAAHVVIACPDCSPQAYGDDFITPDIDDQAAGQAMAAYAMVKSGGSGKFLAFPDKEYTFLQARYEAFIAYLKQNCTSCSVASNDYTVAYLSQSGPPVWTSALSANPKGTVKFAFAPFPFAAQQLAETEHNQGRSDIAIMDFGAAEGATQQLMAGGTLPYIGTITTPEVFEDWVSADLIARALANQPLYKVTGLPGVLTTPDNVKSMLDGSSQPDIDFKSKFKALWQH